MWTRLAAIVLLSSLGACSHAHVQTSEAYLGPVMPRPDRVFVSYFSISPDQVRLDQGVGARITRVVEDQPAGAPQMKAARDTQLALADDLVERLRKYGLPAQIGAGTMDGANDLLVQGQIVSVDQGNRTRRILIGLGSGKSSIGADAQVYHLTAVAPPRFMTAFEGQADSGHMPGAVETMGAGSVAQRAATSTAMTGAAHGVGEARHATDTAEAKGLANAIALRIGQLAVAQGWIQPAAIQ